MAKATGKRLSKEQAKAERHASKARRRRERRQARATLSREEMAGQLRALASQIESGIFTLGDKEVEIPVSADFKLSYRVRPKGGHQIEVKIGWDGLGSVPLLPTE